MNYLAYGIICGYLEMTFAFELKYLCNEVVLIAYVLSIEVRKVSERVRLILFTKIEIRLRFLKIEGKKSSLYL